MRLLKRNLEQTFFKEKCAASDGTNLLLTEAIFKLLSTCIYMYVRPFKCVGLCQACTYHIQLSFFKGMPEYFQLFSIFNVQAVTVIDLPLGH